MKLIRLITGIVLLIFSGTLTSYAQGLKKPKAPSINDYNTLVLFGDEAYEEMDYYGASIYFGKALKTDSTSVELRYKYASSLRQYNAYKKAQKAYQDIYIIDKEHEFPETLYWLATMQKNNGNYDEARLNYMSFASNSEENGGFLHEKAKHEVKSCEYAIEMNKDLASVEISNLGNQVNSSSSEFSPMLANDSVLYFSSLRPKYRDSRKTITDVGSIIKIYKAEKTSYGIWKMIGALDTTINQSMFHSANGSLSPDKKRLYFTRCSKDNICAIYVSTLLDGTWEKPVKLNSDINQEGSTATQPMVAMVHGEEVMFFVSDRKKGVGKLDIWYSILSFEGKVKYSKAKPIKEGVNSKGNEISPFYDSKSNTLFFSSSWHYGYGGFDVFKSYGSYKRFTLPENLGHPYNSSANDLYFSIDTLGTNGFFASNRSESFALEGEICCNDIYNFSINEPIDSKETEKKEVEILRRFLPASLYFQNDMPNPKSNKTETKVSYMTTYNEFSSLKDHYRNECSKGLPEEQAQKARDEMDSFYRDHLDKGVSDLELFLDLLLTQLQKGKKIELTIKGYASPLAKTDYNEKLTLRRISSLINYIREVNDGVFKQFMDINAKGRGHLSIIKVPYGEDKASSSVSASLDDQRSSVYSRAAAMERKIEIISVGLEQE